MSKQYEARTSTGAHLDGSHEADLKMLRDCNREGRFVDIDAIVLRMLGRSRKTSLDTLVNAVVESSWLPNTVKARILVALAERELKVHGYDASSDVARAAHAALQRTDLAASDARMYRIEAAAALADSLPDVACGLLRSAEVRTRSIVAPTDPATGREDPTIRYRAELEDSNALALIELEQGRLGEARAVLDSTRVHRANERIDAWNRIEHELIEALATYQTDPRAAVDVFSRAVCELEAAGARYERARYGLLWGRFAGDADETRRAIELFEAIGVKFIAERERSRIAEMQARNRRLSRIDRATLEALMPNGFPIASEQWHDLLSDLYRSLKGGNYECTLIYGATGTGKSVVTKFIHNALAELHGRNSGRLVEINCATAMAGDTTVVDTELFGQQQGAFTGVRGQQGLLVQADGGTLFLDEIGKMPTALQARLLKVVEDRLVRRLGETAAPTRVDLAIVAATNRDPDELVQRGDWLVDFAARFLRSRVTLPLLASDAVAPMAAYFVRKHVERRGRKRLNMHLDAYDYLERQNWHGQNLRGLEAVIDSAIALLPDDADALTADDLIVASRAAAIPDAPQGVSAPGTVRIVLGPDDVLEIPRHLIGDDLAEVLRALSSRAPRLARQWADVAKGMRTGVAEHFLACYGTHEAASQEFGRTARTTFAGYLRGSV